MTLHLSPSLEFSIQGAQYAAKTAGAAFQIQENNPFHRAQIDSSRTSLKEEPGAGEDRWGERTREASSPERPVDKISPLQSSHTHPEAKTARHHPIRTPDAAAPYSMDGEAMKLSATSLLRHFRLERFRKLAPPTNLAS